jgi:hypothetical protein
MYLGLMLINVDHEDAVQVDRDGKDERIIKLPRVMLRSCTRTCLRLDPFLSFFFSKMLYLPQVSFLHIYTLSTRIYALCSFPGTLFDVLNRRVLSVWRWRPFNASPPQG